MSTTFSLPKRFQSSGVYGLELRTINPQDPEP